MRSGPLASIRSGIARPVRQLLRSRGFDLVRVGPAAGPPVFDAAIDETIAAVRPFTMTSAERVNAVCTATEYLVRHDIPGPVVECGVWRGGSMMAVAKTLVRLGDTSRDLYLFDTFEGMTPPSEHDVDAQGVPARERLAAGEPIVVAAASLDDVRRNMASTGYPESRIHYVEGPVEVTIPGAAPPSIALLRLDTDWYESTKHELEHLFPRVVRHGVLVIDDYGDWQGARKAVDEYLAACLRPVLLNRIDSTGRMAVLS